jgi:ADP-ribosylglycohydrolase/catechol 2,3-dioxygenase-like lactoylglutathione lyase family enzyme
MTRPIDPTLLDRGRGALLGASLGDAAGWPQEPTARRLGKREPFQGKLLKPWKRRHGTQFRWFEEPVDAGAYSDDTQLMLAVARSLKRGPAWFIDLSRVELPTWTLYERGGGGALRAAARSWLRGRPPWDAADAKERARYWNAGGNGAATRVPAHLIRGDLVANSFPADTICIDAVLTHGHPRAILGALVQAFALYFGFQQRDTLDYGELIEVTLDSLPAWSSFRLPAGTLWASRDSENPNFSSLWASTVAETVYLLQTASAAIKRGALSVDRDVLERLGALKKATSGAGTVCAVAALFLASKYADDPLLALQQAAYAYPADTDTIASMVGALMGAIHGVSWLPREIDDLQDMSYIERLATDCVAALSAPNRPPVTASEMERFMASLDETTSRQTVHLPDGRDGYVREAIALRPGAGNGGASMLRVELEDGQTSHIVHTRNVRPSQGQTTDASGRPNPQPSRPSNPRQTEDVETVEAIRVGIRLAVRDLAIARAFYTKVLGLPISKESSESLRIADQLTLVKWTDSAPYLAGTNVRLTVYVRNFDGALRNVMAFKGLSTEAKFVGNQRYFRCADPDDNLVEVVESRPSHNHQAAAPAGVIAGLPDALGRHSSNDRRPGLLELIETNGRSEAAGPFEGDVVRVIPPTNNPNTWIMVVEANDPETPGQLRLLRLPDDGRPAQYESTPAFFNGGRMDVQDTHDTSHALFDIADFNRFFARLGPGRG